MVTLILQTLLGVGVPVMKVVLDLLPTLRKYKLLTTDAEEAEWTRRYKAAIQKAEATSLDPVDARKQYDGASKAVDAEWDKEFGNKPPQ